MKRDWISFTAGSVVTVAIIAAVEGVELVICAVLFVLGGALMLTARTIR